MNWLLYEDKIIALDKFNTLIDPIMAFIVILLLILTTILFFNHFEYKSTGKNILSTKTKITIKLLWLLFLIIIVVVGTTNIIEHYLHELMIFDGYMYIDYKKIIIKIQY